MGLTFERKTLQLQTFTNLVNSMHMIAANAALGSWRRYTIRKSIVWNLASCTTQSINAAICNGFLGIVLELKLSYISGLWWINRVILCIKSGVLFIIYVQLYLNLIKCWRKQRSSPGFWPLPTEVEVLLLLYYCVQNMIIIIPVVF